MKNVEYDISHNGRLVMKVEELGYKALVLTGMIQGQSGIRFGRVIQVRKKSGAYGSDTVLLRESDGMLQSYHNMMFFTIKDEFIHLYEEAMKNVDEQNIDDISHEYSIMENNPAVGFVVEGLDDTNGALYSFVIKSETVK